MSLYDDIDVDEKVEKKPIESESFMKSPVRFG